MTKYRKKSWPKKKENTLYEDVLYYKYLNIVHFLFALFLTVKERPVIDQLFITAINYSNSLLACKLQLYFISILTIQNSRPLLILILSFVLESGLNWGFLIQMLQYNQLI